MLIGIDASRANRGHKSGTEWYAYYLIRWLAKLDKDNEYILYTDKPLKGGLLDLTTAQYFENGAAPEEPVYDKKGCQVIKSPFNNFRAKVLKWPYRLFWTQGRMSIEMILHRPDVLFIPSHTLPMFHPKKSIVTIHDIGYEKYFRLYNREEMGFEDVTTSRLLNILVRIYTFGKYGANTVDYLRWSTGYGLKKADRIIAVSKCTKKEIVDFYKTDGNKISVVYNGYNKKIYKRTEDKEKLERVLAKYGIEQPYLFYIGRIERKKNIPALIEAFAIMRDHNKDFNHKLVLVGDASYGYDETKYMIREFDLVNDVIMPGWVDEADIPYLYGGADVFVFPSMYEGFGIPLLQAMACGIPIAASERTSIPEVVGEAAFLFNPEFALSIAEALERVISDLPLRKKLVEKSAEQITRYSWEKSARKTLEIITYKK